MAATQVFSNKSYSYCVISNASAPTFPTLNGSGESIGYDSVSVIPGLGADTQGQNTAGAETNGSVPDFWIDQKSILNSPATATILFLNPS